MERLTLVAIPIMAAVAAVATLDAGRHAVEAAGRRLVRRALVRESDRAIARTLPDIDRDQGCRAVRAFPVPYRRCVAMVRWEPGAVRIAVMVEPANRLIAPDSMWLVVHEMR